MFAFAVWDERRRPAPARPRPLRREAAVLRDGGGSADVRLRARRAAGRRGRSTLDLDPVAVDAFFVLGYVPRRARSRRDVRQLPAGAPADLGRRRARPRLRRYWSPPAPDAVAAPRGRGGARRRDAAPARGVRARRGCSPTSRSGCCSAAGSTRRWSPRSRARVTDAASRPSRSATTSARSARPMPRARRRRQLGTDHHELRPRRADALAARVPALLAAIDQPIADPALVALNAVAEFARQDVTVAVGGEGADELFGGYPRYRWLRAAQMLDGRLPPRRAPRGRARAARARRRPGAPAGGRARAGARARAPPRLGHGRASARPRCALRRRRCATQSTRRRCTAMCAPHRGERGRLARGGVHAPRPAHWLPDDMLTKADRAGMLVSLEVRTPYLDRELAEFAATVPPEVHLAGGGKPLLRRVLAAGRAGPSPATQARIRGAPGASGCAALCDRCSRSTSAAAACSARGCSSAPRRAGSSSVTAAARATRARCCGRC